jgi:hypothetical protein
MVKGIGEAMSTYSKVIKSILDEIIKVRDTRAISSTVVMTYIAIDTMAFLSMPLNKTKNGNKEFINWVEKYMKNDGMQSYQYSGEDMWAARCGKLHSYSVSSDYANKKSCKLYGYHDGSEHLYNPKESERLVLISTHRLVEDFISGLKAFFRDAIKDKALKQRIDSRIKNVYQQFNINQEDITD